MVIEKLTKPLDSAGRIDCVLEEADGCDTRRVPGDAGLCIAQRDATDGQDRDSDGAADFGQSGEALRFSEGGF